jgi:soluble lytic murein transglycosylase-like protein
LDSLGKEATLAVMTGAGSPPTLLVLLLASTPALAGDLYRCVGADGVPNYSSKRVANAVCTVVAHSQDAPPPRPAPPPAAPTPTADTAGAATKPDATAAADNVRTAGFVPKFLRMGHSTIYSYVDASGVRNFSNRRPKGVASVTATRIEYPIFSQPSCYACALLPGTNFGRVTLNTTAFSGEIRAAATQFGVEEAVVRAIIHAESAFRPHVVSPKNAQGLMQLIPATAKRFGVSDPFDPGQNIQGGVQYLAWLMKRYGSDLTRVAAAYNAGEGAVDRYGGVPPYGETQRYVQRVGQLAERYRSALAGKGG